MPQTQEKVHEKDEGLYIISRSLGLTIVKDYLIDGCVFNEVQFSEKMRPSSISMS